jgi:hypothetical protein
MAESSDCKLSNLGCKNLVRNSSTGSTAHQGSIDPASSASACPYLGCFELNSGVLVVPAELIHCVSGSSQRVCIADHVIQIRLIRGCIIQPDRCPQQLVLPRRRTLHYRISRNSVQALVHAAKCVVDL